MAAPTRTNYKKRILILFVLCGLVFLGLAIKLGVIMIVKGQEYSEKAVEQQTKDTPITAERGTIYDRNMKALAVNAPSYTVWVRPAELTKKQGDTSEMSRILAGITGEDQNTIKTALEKKSALVRIAKSLTSDQADKLRTNMRDGKLPGISVEENTKRYYPYGSFASVALGHTNDDGAGVNGVELAYNEYLSGTAGRIIRNTDASGRQLAYGTEKYYEAKDGLDVVLTLDEVLQHYLESALTSACTDFDAKRSMAIAMDPDTGEILAMGMYPGYDLNEPKAPVREKDIEEFDELKTSEEQLTYWNQMWRNFLVSDTYEPGSTFKLITTAIALEEGLTSTSETFNCTGYYKIGSDTLRCWRYYNPHGIQTLAEAVQHSCNPVFINLGLRIGAEKYFEYLDTFGFTGKTGIDLVGEASSITYNRKSIRTVELATMSYGQGISVTPIQLITAISSIANGGYLMEPHVVKEIKDSDGEIIYKNEPNVLRRTISEETSSEMRAIMQSVVDEGTGKGAYIAGYKIGGKTGTADKVINGKYAAGKVYSSFMCVAPADDPEIAVLFIVDEPQGTHYASQVAVPYVRDFLEEALVYMQVEPKYTEKELANLDTGEITVQDVCGETVDKAKSILTNQGLKVVVMPETSSDTTLKIVDQYPKGNTKVKDGATIYIYTE